MQNASDNLRSAQMSMEDTEDQLNNYTITSPISGTVISEGGQGRATPWAAAAATTETMCAIYDLSYLADDPECGRAGRSSPSRRARSATITADAID